MSADLCPDHTLLPHQDARFKEGRAAAIQRAADWVNDGGFLADMVTRLAIRSESPRADSGPEQLAYLTEVLMPFLAKIGFSCRLLENPDMLRLPALFAQRIEAPDLPTILLYGHGDVLWGMEGEWRDGTDPWAAKVLDGRLFGRGAVDNKGQHTINLQALKTVIEARGTLGFNAKILIEMGEECGSPGLRAIVTTHADDLAADVLIASDGPRLSETQPTVFLGARGVQDFTLRCHLRQGAYHSGNWGGLLANAGLRLAHALAVITDARGKILVPEWRPSHISASVEDALRALRFERGPSDPQTEADWGEPGRLDAMQSLGWCNFEVLAFTCGRPEAPVGAIPGQATAACQLRFVVGIDPDRIIPSLRAHLDAHGFQDIEILHDPADLFLASRTDPDHAWVRFVQSSLAMTLGDTPALAPNFGGALPNDIFADVLHIPTIWIPHSHPACGQHAPDEHMLVSIAKEGVMMMAGLFWDLGAR